MNSKLTDLLLFENQRGKKLYVHSKEFAVFRFGDIREV